MNVPNCIHRLAAVSALLLCVVPAHAQWTLDNAASELRFVTTKNTNIAEVQQFKKLSGEVAASGAVRLDIDLASVETQIPIRNERMQTMLFEVVQFPSARFEGQVDVQRIAALEPGTSADLDVDGKLSLHGKTQDTKALLRVVRLKGERLQVSTRAPILISAAQFDLVAGIDKLREIVGLPNIIGTVPVSFALTFSK
jgi:polyisoprenoid-binding protein YceI